MTTPRPLPVLPSEGRRLAFIGKGGAGKSTMLAHLLSYWRSYEVPVIGIDTDVPGDDEHGTLYDWAQAADIGAPVYPAPAIHQIRNEAIRLTPEKGLTALDTGAWERKQGGPHLAVLSAVDLVVFAMQPTKAEIQRAGSVLGAVQQLEATGARTPRLVILLTMVDKAAGAGDATDEALSNAGYAVLRSRYHLSNAKDGFAQSYGSEVKIRSGSEMDLMAREILDVVAR